MGVERTCCIRSANPVNIAWWQRRAAPSLLLLTILPVLILDLGHKIDALFNHAHSSYGDLAVMGGLRRAGGLALGTSALSLRGLCFGDASYPHTPTLARPTLGPGSMFTPSWLGQWGVSFRSTRSRERRQACTGNGWGREGGGASEPLPAIALARLLSLTGRPARPPWDGIPRATPLAACSLCGPARDASEHSKIQALLSDCLSASAPRAAEDAGRHRKDFRFAASRGFFFCHDAQQKKIKSLRLALI